MKAGTGARGGYALLDVVLAVALFALAVTGLIQVMQRINETSGEFAFDRMLQNRLDGMLAEARNRSVSAMTSEALDPQTGILFRTYAVPYQIDNGEGAALEGLYLLTAEAQFTADGGPQTEHAAIIVHVPEQ